MGCSTSRDAHAESLSTVRRSVSQASERIVHALSSLHGDKGNKDFQSKLVQSKNVAQLLNDFEFAEEGCLGAGITGSVSRVTRKSSNVEYACKSVNMEKFNKYQRQELWNEIRILRELDHPNIVRLYCFYEGRKNMFLMMHYCTGGPLSKRLPRGETRIREVIHQICGAIRYCHLKGICHRDLKLDNVLYEDRTDKSKVMLIDFGLSARYQQDQLKGAVRTHDCKTKAMTTEIGNPWYMAPETKQGGYTEACDMWSLGVLAFVLLAGYLPFDSPRGAPVVAKLARRGVVGFEPSIWRQYSPEAKRFVQALLQVQVHRRWSSQSVMRHAWFKEIEHSSRRSLVVEPMQMASVWAHDEIFSNGMSWEDNINRIIESIEEFAEFRPLKRAAFLIIAHSLPVNETAMGRLREVFIHFDQDQTGLITPEEFELALERYSSLSGIAVAEASSRLFGALDMDKSGRIRYLEFLAATLSSCFSVTDSMLEDAFNLLDRDHSAFITERNLKSLLGKLYTKGEIEQMIQDADFLQNGKVSKDEFFQFMKAHVSQVRAAPCSPSVSVPQELTIGLAESAVGLTVV